MQKTSLVMRKNITDTAITFSTIILTLIMLVFSEKIKAGIINGAKLSFLNIIPTLFPFFILSDLWSVAFASEKRNVFSKYFEKIFFINGSGLYSLLIGMICGFPLGIKSAVSKYEVGLLSKDETERLCGFINNPSAAFVISGVGSGMYGDIRIGIILYFSVVLSAFLVGFLFRKNTKTSYLKEKARQTFNLTASIGSAAVSSITVSSYIIFFSALLGLISTFIKNTAALSIIATLAELCSACSMIYTEFSPLIKTALSLTGFALGFSGFSVHLQAFAFMPKELSRKKYLLMKLMQGFACSIITLLFYLTI